MKEVYKEKQWIVIFSEVDGRRKKRITETYEKVI